ncbi:protein-tyrosine phosphatase-like protein [Zopfochytrium polystomum]|nr:protein-tyrosine phosphatase-like protein [Zopfochytrium polystomum]
MSSPAAATALPPKSISVSIPLPVSLLAKRAKERADALVAKTAALSDPSFPKPPQQPTTGEFGDDAFLSAIVTIPASHSAALSGQSPSGEYGMPNGGGSAISILCHGVFAHKNFSFFPLLAQSWPHPTIRFDFHGAGDSPGVPCVSDYWSEVDDLAFVCEYLRQHDWKVHTVVGHSKGASIALLYAMAYPHVPRFIVAVSPRFNVVQGFSAIFADQMDIISKWGVSYAQIKKRGVNTAALVRNSRDDWQNLDVDMKKTCHISPTLPVLICHGTADERIPVTDASHFASIIQNCSLRLIDGANHNFSNTTPNSPTTTGVPLLSAILDWFTYETTSLRRFWAAWSIVGVHEPKVFPPQTCPQRIVAVDGVKNFRDFGGYPVGNGEWIRSGILYRSAELGSITTAGISTVQRLGIKSVFDLRSNQEVVRRPPSEALNEVARRYHVPVYAEKDFSPEALGVRWKLYESGVLGFPHVYMLILDNGAPVFKKIISSLITVSPEPSKGPEPMVVHCTAGKDRTGVIVAVLLKFLGVADDLIVRDYALTETLLASAGVISLDGVRSMMSSKAEAMVGTLASLAKEYGSAAGYIQKKLGFSAMELSRLRDGLVTKVGEEREPVGVRPYVNPPVWFGDPVLRALL